VSGVSSSAEVLRLQALKEVSKKMVTAVTMVDRKK
jgi:hypothetical protein